MKNNKIKFNKGAAMILVVFFFVFISLTILIGIVSPVVREFKMVRSNFNSKQAYFTAESGIEDAIYRLKNNMDIGVNENLVLGTSFATTTISDIGGNQKSISSTGDVNSHQRKVNLTLSTGTGNSFNYGVQVGQGGIVLEGSSGINGNIYANGPILGSTSSFITGTAISGNSPALIADQSNGNENPTYNVIFGQESTKQDIAQSFQVSNSLPLNKVRFYIKKVGSPNSATVKIVNNSSGKPGTNVYASGTLVNTTVTTSYGWVNVSFTSNPILNLNTTYWLVIDASASNSKYYVIGASNGGYDNGLGKIGQQGATWNDTTPTELDYYFGIYLGGFNGLIAGSSGSQWNQLSVGTGGQGSAQAHTVNYTEATGPIYCQTGTGNNKSCTIQDDPVYIDFPISDGNITQWKSEAETGPLHSGSYTTPSYGTSTLGPVKITGDLNVIGSHILYLTGTVWVQGNVTVSGSAKIVLSPGIYGSGSGVLVSDGWLSLSGSGQLNGTGQAGSYLLFVTTSNCNISYCAHNAIDISGAAGSVILNAQKGTISFTGSASAKQATAYKMLLTGATVVNYESGLINVNFSSGPSGSWNVSEWRETE